MKQLTVVIPTRNEAKALPIVIVGLINALVGFDYTILIVDDGDDDTPDVISCLNLYQVELLRRPSDRRNGLAGAVIEGFLRSDSEYVAVMDGDGQHPPETLPHLLMAAQNEDHEIVMGSRYCQGRADNHGLDGSLRRFYSDSLRRLPRLFFPRLSHVTDPLGGFFLVRRCCLRMDKIRPIGWKISLEVLLFSNYDRYAEIAYEFQSRVDGESKANLRVGLSYFQQLMSLATRYYLAKR